MNAQDKAKFARQLYYARLGEVDKAFSEPSSDSLAAWVIVIDTLDKMNTPKDERTGTGPSTINVGEVKTNKT